MKPFVFRMQTKLDVVAREEDLVRQQLQHRVDERDRVQNDLNEVVTQVEELENALVQMMHGTVHVDRMLLMRNYLPVLNEIRHDKELELLQAEKKVEITRNQLVNKRKETRILEKLKERDWREYTVELNREEQKILDEIAINGHYRTHEE